MVLIGHQQLTSSHLTSPSTHSLSNMASEGKESQMEMQEMPDMRDLEKARVAFNKRDVAASRAAHMSTGEGKLLQVSKALALHHTRVTLALPVRTS